jgi:hypothetical protein
MELEEILSALSVYRGRLPVEELEAASARQEQVTPHLLKSLEELPARAAELVEDQDAMFHLFALYLLAQFREHKAYPLVVRVCRMPAEYVDGLWGDTITEDMGRVLASVWGGGLEPLKSLVEDGDVEPYTRGAALRALSVLALEGMVPRDVVIAYHAALFRGKLPRTPSFVWDELASEAVDLHARTLAHDIEQAYRDGLLDPGFMDPDFVKEHLEMDRETALARARKMRGGLMKSAVEEMEGWACFRGDRSDKVNKPEPYADEERRVIHDALDGPYERVEPKVGRNDPCPCGSGKKAKKCCGGA